MINFLTKFQAGTLFPSQVMVFQVHAVGKAIRSLFADPVTYHVVHTHKAGTQLLHIQLTSTKHVYMMPVTTNTELSYRTNFVMLLDILQGAT